MADSLLTELLHDFVTNDPDIVPRGSNAAETEEICRQWRNAIFTHVQRVLANIPKVQHTPGTVRMIMYNALEGSKHYSAYRDFCASTNKHPLTLQVFSRPEVVRRWRDLVEADALQRRPLYVLADKRVYRAGTLNADLSIILGYANALRPGDPCTIISFDIEKEAQKIFAEVTLSAPNDGFDYLDIMKENETQLLSDIFTNLLSQKDYSLENFKRVARGVCEMWLDRYSVERQYEEYVALMQYQDLEPIDWSTAVNGQLLVDDWRRMNQVGLRTGQKVTVRGLEFELMRINPDLTLSFVAQREGGEDISLELTLDELFDQI